MRRTLVVATMRLLALLVALVASTSRLGAEQASPEAVVLLHGLGRTDRSMRPLADRLVAAGFEVCNLRYPSTSLTPDKLVAKLDAEISACGAHASRLDFVGHSLGGILVRAYLAEKQPANLGRVVMLAPPNGGSEYVDLLGRSHLFRWILGPTAIELGTGPMSLPHRLPRPTFELGVIAGTRSLNPFSAWVLPGDHDGTVTVASTKLDGMKDFLAVASNHTFIMRSDAVGTAVINFLRYGFFLSAEAEAR